MLKRILEELQAANGPIRLSEFSRTLDIDRSALDGMMMQLVRLGKLREVTAERPDCSHCKGCVSSCAPAAEGKVYAAVDST